MLKERKRKVLTRFSPQIRSKHPSYDNLRGRLEKLPFRSVVRFGSTTEIGDERRLGGNRIEINTPDSIRNSADKLKMKQCFTQAGVKTAKWGKANAYSSITNEGVVYTQHDLPNTILNYPIIAKHRFGARGEGNTKLDNQQELEAWMTGKTLSNYIFEKFYTYSREYRLHVSILGECFYTCRKMLRRDTPESETWHRHDDNCVWILEENPSFNKPGNWEAIVEDCVKALKSLGGDIMGFDVKMQGSSKQNPEWIILESNSACSLGEMTTVKYKEHIPLVLKYKKSL